MFLEERQNSIIDDVNKHGRVKVKDLSVKFGVSEDCIRKDLTQLAQKGLLKKTYGGAVKVRINIHKLGVEDRKGENIENKKKIADKAMEFIKEGETIFLDISTINIEIAKQLSKIDKNITVVTNMIDVLLQLTKSKNIEVVFIGGSLNKAKDGFVGNMSEQIISNFRFDKSFMGVVGIDLYENSLETYNVIDGITKKEILKRSEKKYLLAENKKFSNQGSYKYAELDEINSIITDKKPSDDILETIKKESYNIEIIF